MRDRGGTLLSKTSVMLAATDTARWGVQQEREKEREEEVSADVGCRPGDGLYMLRSGATLVAFGVTGQTLVAVSIAAETQRRKLRQVENACDLMNAGGQRDVAQESPRCRVRALQDSRIHVLADSEMSAEAPRQLVWMSPSLRGTDTSGVV